MAIERAMGVPIKDIAERYGMAPGSVKRSLSSVEESGLIEHFRTLVYERLVSKALAVYEAQLDMGNLEAARDIAFGLGVLQKDPLKTKAVKAIDTLAAYRAERAEKAIVVTTTAESETNAKLQQLDDPASELHGESDQA